jgi:hypothetical protein
MHEAPAEFWHLPVQLQSLVEAEVSGGEQVVWVGTPRRSRLMIETLPRFGFGIIWTAFSIFWVYGAAGFQWPQFGKVDDLFPLFGIPFVLVGCGMLLSPAWIWMRSAGMVYVVTTERAIIIERGFATSIRSYDPSQLQRLQKIQRGDQSGDLIFEQTSWPIETQGYRRHRHAFVGVDNVNEVEAHIRRLTRVDPT